MKTTWHSISPELPVSDLSSAIGFFETHMGFITDFQLDDIGYGKVSRDGQSVFLSVAEPPFEPRTCMIYSEDIQASYQEMKNAGLTITSELRTLSVGSTEFSVRVTDGHIFTFFQ